MNKHWDEATRQRHIQVTWTRLGRMQEALRHFSPAARAAARAEIFGYEVQSPHWEGSTCFAGSCGRCVVATLVAHDFPTEYHQIHAKERAFLNPDDAYAAMVRAEVVGEVSWDDDDPAYRLYDGLTALVALNDLGGLRTPADIKRLFDGLD